MSLPVPVAFAIVSLFSVIQFLISALEDVALNSRDYGFYGFLKIVHLLIFASVMVIVKLTPL